MLISPTFKQGNYFEATGVYKEAGVAIDLTPFTITSTVRAPDDTTLTNLTVSKADQVTNPGRFTLSSAATAAWPICGVNCDVRFVNAEGKIHSTQTFVIPVVKAETR